MNERYDSCIGTFASMLWDFGNFKPVFDCEISLSRSSIWLDLTCCRNVMNNSLDISFQSLLIAMVLDFDQDALSIVLPP